MNEWNSAVERQSQLQYGRSMAASDQYHGHNGHEESNFNPMRQFGSHPRRQRIDAISEPARNKGHVQYLRSLQRTGSSLRVVTINGDVVVGVVKDCDDDTLTLKVDVPTSVNPDAYQNRVFIKSNLIEFAPIVQGVTFN
jgi:hypothetical protein